HAMNNSLLAVLGPLELLLEDAPADPGLRQRLERIRDASLELRDLGRALGVAARESVGEPRRLSLADVCAGAVELARATSLRGIEITERYPDEPVEVEASASELRQIVLALLDRAEGRVELALSRDGAEARLAVSPGPEEGIALEVAR